MHCSGDILKSSQSFQFRDLPLTFTSSLPLSVLKLMRRVGEFPGHLLVSAWGIISYLSRMSHPGRINLFGTTS